MTLSSTMFELEEATDVKMAVEQANETSLTMAEDEENISSVYHLTKNDKQVLLDSTQCTLPLELQDFRLSSV
jgi:uncharacterized protein YpbB